MTHSYTDLFYHLVFSTKHPGRPRGNCGLSRRWDDFCHPCGVFAGEVKLAQGSAVAPPWAKTALPPGGG